MKKRVMMMNILLILVMAFPVLAGPLGTNKTAQDFSAQSVLILHYNRSNADYDGWNLWVWAEGKEGQALQFSGSDEFGAYAILTLNEKTNKIGFIVRKGDWAEKDGDQDRFADINSQGIAEIWVSQGQPQASTTAPAVSTGSAETKTGATAFAAGKTAADFNGKTALIVHYNRPSGDYADWNLWSWADGGEGGVFQFSDGDEYGPFTVVSFQQQYNKLGFIVRKGDWVEKDGDQDRFVNIPASGVAEIWVKKGQASFSTDPATVTFVKAKAPPKAKLPDVALIKPIAPASANGTLVIFHYFRYDNNYTKWNIWAWGEGAEGGAQQFTGKDEFGVYSEIKFPQNVNKVGFLLRKGEWEDKDFGGDRFITVNSNGVAEVWIISGDKEVYTDIKQLDFSPKVKMAFLDSPEMIKVFLSVAADPNEFPAAKMSLKTASREYRIKEAKAQGFAIGGSNKFQLMLEEKLNPEDLHGKCELQLPGYSPYLVYARDILNDPDYYDLTAKLGVDYAREQISFRTWSPVSENVELLLYDSAEAPQPAKTFAMNKGANPTGSGAKGIWSITLKGDLHGYYYQYRFNSYGEARTVADIHGYAASKDSERSMVVDMSRTNPAGWENDPLPKIKHQTDEILYEIHVRDYSIADPNCPPQLRGKYLGLAHQNTGSISTGIRHLLDLGVTAVHLLPVQDIGIGMNDYSWGYWTALFNVPEAQYSTNWADPTSAIRDLKTMINELHKAGIRVIMDVVYNHTNSSFSTSPFDQAVPWYYFRTTEDGQLKNESGCGNAVADERPMVRKYIVDSLEHWIREYHIDGFRFDLLGMHHKETVAEIEQRLLPLRPDLTLYGEPWTGGGPTYFGKGTQKGMRMAVFNDHMRGAVRGDPDGTDRGYAMGDRGRNNNVKKGVVAAIAYDGGLTDFALEPSECVNYVSAHDNLTLWDKINRAVGGASDETKRQMQKFALGIILTSQGMTFLHGGTDFCRTKNGEHNSYNSGDRINKFDWDRKKEYLDVHKYVSGLIAMRRAHPAFHMDSADLIRQNVKFINTNYQLIMFELNGAAIGDSWKRIIVIYNPDSSGVGAFLPDGVWNQAVDETSAGVSSLTTVSGEYKLAPYSLAVFYQN